jgi:two-component system response regulator RegX3
MMTSTAFSFPSEYPATPVWRSGDLEIDPARWLLRLEGASATITFKELGILRILIGAGGAAVPRGEMWSPKSSTLPNSSRSLDAHVWSLRKKLERDPANPVHLITILGYGYQLV